MVAPEMSREMSRAAPVRHPQKARIGTQSGVTSARGTPGANSGCRKCSTAKKRRGTATKTLATMRMGFIRVAASAKRATGEGEVSESDCPDHPVIRVGCDVRDVDH
jgi:hypothetical protein